MCVCVCVCIVLLAVSCLGDAQQDEYVPNSQAIAAALRENHTLQTLYLGDNRLGEGGTQAIADVLRENSTFQTLNLHGNSLEGGVKSAVRQSWGNRGGTLELDAVERRQRSTAATSLGHGTRAERP